FPLTKGGSHTHKAAQRSDRRPSPGSTSSPRSGSTCSPRAAAGRGGKEGARPGGRRCSPFEGGGPCAAGGACLLGRALPLIFDGVSSFVPEQIARGVGLTGPGVPRGIGLRCRIRGAWLPAGAYRGAGFDIRR